MPEIISTYEILITKSFVLLIPVYSINFDQREAMVEEGKYKKRSRHASPSKGYNIIVEQIQGEQENINNIILTENVAIVIHPNNVFLSDVKEDISSSKEGTLDCVVEEDTRANLESSTETTSGVSSPSPCLALSS